jgi:hypothetical protein
MCKCNTFTLAIATYPKAILLQLPPVPFTKPKYSGINSLHRRHDRSCQLHLPALVHDVDKSVVREDIMFNSPPLHFGKHRLRIFLQTTPTAHNNQRIERDAVGLHALLLHLLENVNGLLQVHSALPACIDNLLYVISFGLHPAFFIAWKTLSASRHRP